MREGCIEWHLSFYSFSLPLLNENKISPFPSSTTSPPFLPYFFPPSERTEADLAVVVDVGVEHLRHKPHRRRLGREGGRERGREGGKKNEKMAVCLALIAPLFQSARNKCPDTLLAFMPQPRPPPAYLVGVVLCELQEQLKGATFPGCVVRSENDRLPGHDLGEREARRKGG